MIYTLTHLGSLWRQPGLLAEAEEIVERLPNLIEQDDQFDLVAGAAGCIGSLIGLYRWAPADRTLAAAVQCGQPAPCPRSTRGPGRRLGSPI